MLTITLNPLFGNNQGGVSLSGSVTDPDAVIKWRWYDEEEFTTDYVRQSGISFSIDFRFASNSDAIIIQASKGVELSNSISVDLSTSAASKLEPSFKFNEFDELGLAGDVERLPAEDNEDFRLRIHDVYKKPGGPTKAGLSSGIERELGLPHLDPFFYLSTRWSPILNGPYENVYINFDNNAVSVQLKSYIKAKELIEINPVTNQFTTQEEVGSELPEDNIRVEILNGDKMLPSWLWTYLGDSKFEIDMTHPDIDGTKRLTISYPYKQSFYYKKVNDITNETEVASVSDVRTWLRELETVVDENSQTKPLINWNDGFYVAVPELPLGASFEVKECIEDAINNTPSVDYIKLANDPDQPYYKYETPFIAKGFFNAPQIISTNTVILNATPFKVNGTWIVMNEFHDDNFLAFLDTNDVVESNKNLGKYAEELRDAVRMGMSNSLVNHDYWGSDSPAIIGDNFLPSRFDGGIQAFKSLSSEGSIVELSLKHRKFYAKQIAMAIDV